jgi:hypothetical protein
MADREIDVVCYAGHRGEESPRSFMLGDEKIEVTAITKEWIEESAADRTRKRFFKVRGDDGFTYTLYYDEGVSAWFLTNR